MALLSIVLPAYNEEQNISNTARVLSDMLRKIRSNTNWFLSATAPETAPLRKSKRKQRETLESRERNSAVILARKRGFLRDLPWHRGMP